MLLVAPSRFLAAGGALGARFAGQLLDEASEATPREPLGAEVEQIEPVSLEEIGFERFCVFREEREKRRYSGRLRSKPSSTIAISTAAEPPAATNAV